MSFNFNFGNNTSGTNTDRKQVDWDALNKEVIDVVGTQKKAKSVVGFISGIIALGKQPQPDAEIVFVGTEEDERKAVAEKPMTYFKDGTDDKGNPVRLKCWPQKAVDCVAVTVDFPQYTVDKSKYFDGESKPLPLRLLMNGEFVFKGQAFNERCLGRLYKLNVRKNKDDKWSLAPNNKLYQMAVATGVIEDGEPFLPNDIGNLIGKPALFEIRVYLKNDKYMTEEISLAGMIPEGLPTPEYDGSTTYGVFFNAPNNVECLKQLRVSIRNQMKKAEDYEGSVVQKELDELFKQGSVSGNAQANTEKPVEAPAKPKEREVKNAPPIDFDTDIPFNRFMSGKLGYTV